MAADSLSFIFLNTVLANNFVLAMFLGLCPFLGVSGRLETALPMGLATTFVMLVSSVCAYAINLALVALDIEFLRLIAYIALIASAVQLVEMALKKYSPALFRSLGIYLPLITTNCAILGLALFQTFKHYDFTQSLDICPGRRRRLHSGHPAHGRAARTAGPVEGTQRDPGGGPQPDAGRTAVAQLHGLCRPRRGTLRCSGSWPPCCWFPRCC